MKNSVVEFVFIPEQKRKMKPHQIVSVKLRSENKPAYFDCFSDGSALFGTQAQGKVFQSKGEAKRFAQDYLFTSDAEFCIVLEQS